MTPMRSLGSTTNMNEAPAAGAQILPATAARAEGDLEEVLDPVVEIDPRSSSFRARTC